MNKYLKPTQGAARDNRHYVLPGSFFVTRDDIQISTMLGSCVAACIRDPISGLAGMNHFLLPSTNHQLVDRAERYGNYAMESLINQLLGMGAKKRNLEVKLFGGAKMLTKMSDIGAKNIAFVQHYITAENLTLISSDLGGNQPRKVIFIPSTGQVYVRKLPPLSITKIIQSEKNLLEKIESDDTDGSIELFE